MPCLSHNMQRCPPWFSGTLILVQSGFSQETNDVENVEMPCVLTFRQGLILAPTSRTETTSRLPCKAGVIPRRSLMWAPTSPRRRMVRWPLKAAPFESHLSLHLPQAMASMVLYVHAQPRGAAESRRHYLSRWESVAVATFVQAKLHHSSSVWR